MIRILPSVVLAVAGATALGSVLVHAQDPVGRPGQAGGAQDAARDDANRLLATWLLAGNELEIELAQIAQKEAQSAKVQEFAQRMVADHQQLGQKLERFAGDVQIEGGGRPIEAGAPRQGEGFDHVALVEELGKAYLESGKKLLQEKQGEAFDNAFVGMQVIQHTQLLDMIQVFEKHASGELQSILQQGRQTVQQHVREVKQLADEVMGGAHEKK